jgi:SAM-dependent methyltransferase
MTKTYDRAYFDRYYRHRSTRVHDRGEVRRKAALAIASCEYVLRRPLRTVLDIGCGEGAWLGHLRYFRPRIQYMGLDSSDYAVQRFGRARNIHKATLGDLPSLDLGAVDLVICSDVMHYVSEEEIHVAAKTIADVCEGAAYIEVLTTEDDVVGDLQGFLFRPANWYRTAFRKAGLTQVAPYTWVPRGVRVTLSELELP